MTQTRASFLAVIGQQVGEESRNLKYDPDYCQTIRILAQGGDFPESWAAEIGVSLETLRLWGHRYPEFRDAMIISKHLLASYWTREIAKQKDNPKAQPAMYRMLARRLPALFGDAPVDLTDWLLRPDDGNSDVANGTSFTATLTQDAARAMTEDDLRARLEALRRRRQEESDG